MHHGKVSYLESPSRREEFSPEQLLDMIPLNESDHVLDFGAGTGYFTIPAAKRVEGRVYAMDIDPDMLEMINEKVVKEQLDNVVTVEGSMEALPSPDGSIDVVIASLVLHEIQPLAALLEQMKKILKKNGYLICLELEPKKSSGHAPRITQEGMKREMIEAGFDIKEVYVPADSLYLVIAQKVK
ncbi:class I SAM-dependent methyltransferase [Jeotgalibacillus haloalkalitolerans]|uniref:Class I SAM-dependent methyltransferase n=1 Tax=Jeotgalibacillus haloalkalitolerans TaxID=3104292 RepID=A0ABU5KN06_9BACL|nr:class I SAM-dependent methyltransferase [Jeotgalibacillus sp. HH7-29]MDZ5712641.1 class I SAM-dependent methyltransferase [Jeotgalibacillus sp. HH7-29]